DLAGLEDKQAAAAVRLDPATWSKFKMGGDRAPGFTEAMLDGTLFSIAGNDLALHALAYRNGYYLEHRETELERQLRLERESNERLKAENALLRSLLPVRS